MVTCTCENTYQNTGRPNCENAFSNTSGLIAVPMVANDGTENYIDLTATLDQAYLTAKLNHADPSKRWYPIMNIKNVLSEKADTVYQEYDDGSKSKVRTGLRSYNFITNKASATYLGKLLGLGCANFGVFKISVDGQLGGDLREATKLYPIEVENQSWDPKYQFANNSPQVSHIAISFDVKQFVKDESFAIIETSEFGNVNLNTIRGLLDVYATISNITTTGFKIKLFYSYGTAIKKQPFTGAVVADFVSSNNLATGQIYNVTDAANVAITSVTEANPGEYNVVVPAQTSADVFNVLLKKNGFDFSTIDDAGNTIP